MKLTSKEFLWIQAGIILLLLATIDSIIRGPIEQVNEQLKYNAWIYHGVIDKRTDMISQILEQGAK